MLYFILAPQLWFPGGTGRTSRTEALRKLRKKEGERGHARIGGSNLGNLKLSEWADTKDGD